MAPAYPQNVDKSVLSCFLTFPFRKSLLFGLLFRVFAPSFLSLPFFCVTFLMEIFLCGKNMFFFRNSPNSCSKLPYYYGIMVSCPSGARPSTSPVESTGRKCAKCGHRGLCGNPFPLPLFSPQACLHPKVPRCLGKSCFSTVPTSPITTTTKYYNIYTLFTKEAPCAFTSTRSSSTQAFPPW